MIGFFKKLIKMKSFEFFAAKSLSYQLLNIRLTVASKGAMRIKPYACPGWL